MDEAASIFNYVKEFDSETWRKIKMIIKPHKMSSVLEIFREHLNNLPDLLVFNQHQENIPQFLLEFCKAIQRNFLSPGDPFGILLTCRVTKLYTQNTLDKRHLKDVLPTLSNYKVEKDLLFELNIFTSLNQIFEIANKRKFTTLFVTGYEVSELLNISKEETCYLSINNKNNKASNIENHNVYFCLKRFIVLDSFVENYSKIICQKIDDRDYLMRNLKLTRVVALSDVKYVFKKCGIVCYFFNLINLLKLQFFKTMHSTGRNFKDIINILKFQCHMGEPLPLNRNGLKKHPNRSGLEKLCFEAVKQNYVLESIQSKMYDVNDSVSKIVFGEQFVEGTGYKFSLLTNTQH
nr:uncharacterized protein LOC122272646 [Parasteatoda tepidariorum]